MKSKEKLAIRILLFAARIVIGYSFSDDFKAMYEEINKELKTADNE